MRTRRLGVKDEWKNVKEATEHATIQTLVTRYKN
jgi:hypothetical protein